MSDAYESNSACSLIAGLAEAIREELGEEVEDHLGRHDPAEAGQANRIYRAGARRILRPALPPGEGLEALLSWVLARIARRRLLAEGLDERRADALLAREPAGRDDWAAYLTLAPASRLRSLLVDEGIDPA